MAEKMMLLPCPFCGAPAAKNRNPGDRWVYYCPNGHTGYLRHKEWQARSHLAQPAQAVDALQDAIFQIAERLGEVRDPGMDDMSWHTQLIARAQYLANAQAVDVGAVREVAEELGKDGGRLHDEWMHKLNRAIGNAQAEE